ncbi:2-succinyl-6-hydroxy-2,4-cyclohexadiene-1-carboxylate synthase [Thiorhodospira sibirica]|uniref:2-succinyl-6-hydroxy-2, 4-cyclohexadiene-1-carboxylate synthase n=1 Tax=Thiorhodospira sibirica TaxID=154347 RepID=UPI00022C0468|nr:2-succinyl-6-hydroxy-2,4-cyclohexadiene-1-carboxylate synthase [Thiorhodospira sibirica]
MPSTACVSFLHGFLGSGADWQPWREDLQAQGLMVLAPDMPGHGVTPGPFEDCADFDSTVAALAQWLEAQHPGPVHLVGYSMGGRLALALALRYPQQIQSAHILSASPGLEQLDKQLARQVHDDALAERLARDFPGFIMDWYRQPLFASLRRQPEFTTLEKQRRQGDPARLARALRHLSLGRQPSLWDALEQHPRPLHICVGDLDRKYHTLGKTLVSRCPSARLHVFIGCGHALHLEDKAAFRRYLYRTLGLG